jgi:hypothetical protein
VIKTLCLHNRRRRLRPFAVDAVDRRRRLLCESEAFYSSPVSTELICRRQQITCAEDHLSRADRPLHRCGAFGVVRRRSAGSNFAEQRVNLSKLFDAGDRRRRCDIRQHPVVIRSVAAAARSLHRSDQRDAIQRQVKIFCHAEQTTNGANGL